MAPLYTIQHLMRLPVQTESGKNLGHIVDAEIDDVRLEIIRIAVQPAGVSGFFSNPLLIHKDQIIQVTPDAIIVSDTSTKETSKQAVSA